MTRMNFQRTFKNGNVCEAHVFYVYISGTVSYSIEAPFNNQFDFDVNTLDEAIEAIERHGFDVSACTCEVF